MPAPELLASFADGTDCALPLLVVVAFFVGATVLLAGRVFAFGFDEVASCSASLVWRRSFKVVDIVGVHVEMDATAVRTASIWSLTDAISRSLYDSRLL